MIGKEQMTRPPNPLQPELKNMTEEEVQDYLTQLSKSKGENLEGLEAEAHVQLTELSKRAMAANQTIQKLKEEMKNMGGQMEAYTNLLVLAEDGRRGEKRPRIMPPAEAPKEGEENVNASRPNADDENVREEVAQE